MNMVVVVTLIGWMTHPMPKRAKPLDPLDINPAHSIPVAPENYVWQVTPLSKNALEARVFVLGYERNPIGVGTIAAKTEIELEETAHFGTTTYYAVSPNRIKMESAIQFPSGTRFWVRGLDIKATARKPGAK